MPSVEILTEECLFKTRHSEPFGIDDFTIRPIWKISDYGVVFKLHRDGLDRWRRRFLGSPREQLLKELYEPSTK